MNTVELDKLCRDDKEISKLFVGVFACDRLPERIPIPCCLIGNTKPSTHPGEHWVAIYIDEESRGTYFCSYGQEPNAKIRSWLHKQTDEWKRSKQKIQGVLSLTCGHYCVSYLYFRCRSLSLTNFLSLFTNDYEENDLIVSNFIDCM